jgi:hypothetical protein
MPNLAFQLQVLDKVIDQLVAAGDARGTAMQNNKAFAALGAIYSLVFRFLVVPAWPSFGNIQDFLDDADRIAADQSELGVIGLLEQIGDIQTQSNTLAMTLPPVIASLTNIIGQILTLPPWMEQTGTLPLTPADPTADRLPEFLRWHKTGDFATNLLQMATTDPQKAYAMGFITHLAASVTGEPFINNITGGPYRTHWWRNRLVSNYVDSWTYGFYESMAKMMGDEPSPAYANWSTICEANLQDEINVGGLTEASGNDVPDAVKAVATGDLGTLPDTFPSDLANLLVNAINAAYPAGTQPLAGFSSDSIKQSFVGAFAVYWFMTSGAGPMSYNALGDAPTDCTTEPSWITAGGSPSPQESGLNTGGAACAVVLAILALLAILSGDLPAGLAALAAILAAPVIDWDKVRCNLYWQRKTLVDQENALRDALVSNGLGYPPPYKLGTTGFDDRTLPVVDASMVPLCKSNGIATGNSNLKLSPGYPQKLDVSNMAADLNYQSYPGPGVEEPSTQNLIAANSYPNLVVDGSGLQNGGILADGAYPSRYQFFGDAVANAVRVLQADAKDLPNYNLDADRGYGWKTWNPKPGSTPANPPVIDVNES